MSSNEYDLGAEIGGIKADVKTLKDTTDRIEGSICEMRKDIQVVNTNKVSKGNVSWIISIVAVIVAFFKN